ncbi:hypothetical protein GCM10017567_35430 [Amycolatopsis bullii]|uniref:ATPase dynein-related AAA domain-containing protein n=1 Tax=Amycolatopsis bullii TaxID=941987 RepID=A0ABQ3KHF6_9PSEU|nr:AAA family ATPase [Amycolatopsis bullii]GHG14467.1 hypothetical protein GCM10017567_35430 [Amycolatopsis bullii]
MIQLLDEKKQVIFQGSPGTGKTYIARKLAEWIAKSADRVRLVQFHPTYSYEDFVDGYRPRQDGSEFGLTKGPLQLNLELRYEPKELAVYATTSPGVDSACVRGRSCSLSTRLTQGRPHQLQPAI